MNRKKSAWKLFFLSISLLGVFFVCRYFFSARIPFFQRKALDFSQNPKTVTLKSDEMSFVVSTKSGTVDEFLQEKRISLTDQDNIYPGKSAVLYPGMQIAIDHAIALTIKVDDKTIKTQSPAKTVYGALEENNIALGRLDSTSQPLYARFGNGDTITVTRINVEEKVVNEDINYKTINKTDNKLGWREERTDQQGKKGVREVKYKITYKNNVEVSRVILEKNILQDPIDAIITKGTYMKLGKRDSGQGTWYSFQGGLFAASTTIPKGSYAKVTNTANGKSVVVEINDYGPFGKGRIIDLDKVAFTKIAPIGSGVIGVKVEPILN